MPNTVNSYIETDLGNVSPNPRGEYNAKYDYEYLDLTYYKGGSYLCLAPLGETIKNVPPIEGQTTTNWQCVAIPGDLTPEYISMYNEVVNDYNETNTNTADVAQMKDVTYASMTAAQESESKASTSEANARNSEVNAKQSMDKAKEYSDEAIRVNNDTQSLVTGFDEHVATAISNAEASISESTDNAKEEIVAQKSSSLNEFRTDAETVMTNEKNVAVTEIHQMVDDFSTDADSKKQEIIQVADEKINDMTALKNDTVNAKNAAETAATTAVEKASETATYAGEAKSSSNSAKANADLVSANKIEIDNAKRDVDSKVEQFESDLETYSVRTLRSDMTELQKETSDGFSALKGDLAYEQDITNNKKSTELIYLTKGYISNGKFNSTANKNTDYGTFGFQKANNGSYVENLSDSTIVNVCVYNSEDETDIFESYKIIGSGKYIIKGNKFVRFSIYKADDSDFVDSNEAFSYLNLVIYNTTIKEDVSALKEDVSALKPSISIFDKSNVIDFGVLTTGYYEGMDTYSDAFGRETKYTEVLSKFDELIDSNGYMTKNIIGKSSPWNYDIVEYDFTPISLVYESDKNIPKVLIISGQHGMEKASVYGIYYFIKDLMTKYNDNEVLSYIRNNVALKIIPIVNPSGFNINGYVNGNGVNINRNYGTSGFPSSPSAEVGSNQYGGIEPFDQEETRCVRELILNNLDSVAFIDYHTNGSSAISRFEQVNWHDYPITANTKNNDYYKKFIEIGCGHVRNISGHFISEYDLNTKGKPCGEITQASAEGFPSADTYACDNGILGLTFEGFAGFPNEETYTNRVLKANSELIGNYIISVLNGLR